MEHVYCVLDKQSYKYTPKICKTFLFQLHEWGSILRDTSHVLLYLQVLWMKYHHNIHRLLASAPLLSPILVSRCSVYLDRWIQPTANFALYIEVHECFSQMPEKVFTWLCFENFKINLFSVYSSSTYSRQQYLHYSTLVVLCSLL